MSTYHFGLGNGRVKASIVKQAERIAKRHDAYFVATTLPGQGHRFWFSGPNLGFPFDRAMAQAVKADLVAAGIADENSFIAEKHLAGRR